MPRWVKFFVHFAFGAAIALVAGTFIHEAGHAAVAAWNGATIQEVNVVGIRLYPPLAFEPRAGYYGYVTWAGELSPRADLWTTAAGSTATGLASLIAAWRLRRAKSFRLGGFRATAHLAFLSMCGDALVHTLPAVGIPAYLFFGPREAGPRISELYHAAVALGARPDAVLIAVFGYPAVAFGLVIGKAGRGAGGAGEGPAMREKGRGRKAP